VECNKLVIDKSIKINQKKYIFADMTSD